MRGVMNSSSTRRASKRRSVCRTSGSGVHKASVGVSGVLGDSLSLTARRVRDCGVSTPVRRASAASTLLMSSLRQRITSRASLSCGNTSSMALEAATSWMRRWCCSWSR
eukprot:scaffold249965_cov33-Tisochrysis_lutea.AAC.1